jgi:hypothetical protein
MQATNGFCSPPRQDKEENEENEHAPLLLGNGSLLVGILSPQNTPFSREGMQ